VRKLVESSLLVVFLLCAPAVAVAHSDPDRSTSAWYVQVGAYDHFSDDEDYEGPPLFGGIEYHRANMPVIGFSIFNNSFGDFSQYLYLGKEFYPSQKYPGFRFKLTGGVAHGYKGENHDVLPIRWGNSWGFGVVPIIGYKSNRVGVDLALLSDSGLLLLVGYEF
jgi:hypothetical protein